MEIEIDSVFRNRESGRWSRLIAISENGNVAMKDRKEIDCSSHRFPPSSTVCYTLQLFLFFIRKFLINLLTREERSLFGSCPKRACNRCSGWFFARLVSKSFVEGDRKWNFCLLFYRSTRQFSTLIALYFILIDRFIVLTLERLTHCTWLTFRQHLYFYSNDTVRYAWNLFKKCKLYSFCFACLLVCFSIVCHTANSSCTIHGERYTNWECITRAKNMTRKQFSRMEN